MVQMLSPISMEAPAFVPPKDPAIPQQNIAYDEEYEDLKARILAGIEQKKRDRDSQIASLQEGAKRDINPWLKAGMAGIRGQDPLAAYQAAQLPIEAREAKIRELSSLDFDDEHKRLIDLSKVVAQRMKAAQTANKPWKPDAKVINGQLVEYDPNTRKTRVVHQNVRNSPLYGQIQKKVADESMDPRLNFKDDAQRLQWIEQQTEERFSKAWAKDDTSVGTVPAREVGVTPAQERVADKPVVEIQPSVSERSPADVMIPPAIKPEAGFIGAKPVDHVGNVEMIRQRLRSMGMDHPGRKALQEELDKELAFGKYEAPPQIDMRGFAPAATPGLGKPQPVDTRITAPVQAKTTPLQTPIITEQPIVTPELLTPAQLEMRKQDAQGLSKYLEPMPTSLSSVNQGLATVKRLEDATLNSETTHGPAAEFWQQAGGIASYFDPQSKLSLEAAGAEAYYGDLMNLVRDKIKALGAGTAVSNLDLIVTEKSLGALHNTQQGRLKLLGILRATMLAEQSLLNKKMEFAQNRPDITSVSKFNTEFRKHIEKDGPMYAIMPHNLAKQSKKNRSGKPIQLTQYVPIMRDRWIEQARVVNPKKTDAELLSAWNKFADGNEQAKMMGLGK